MNIVPAKEVYPVLDFAHSMVTRKFLLRGKHVRTRNADIIQPLETMNGALDEEFLG